MTRRWLVFTIVSAGVFLSSLDLFIVNIAFPAVQRDFSGATLAQLSWILDAYAIVFAALLVPAGRIADRTGRKRAFLVGLGVFSLASAACAAATSVEMLVAFRVVQAAGAALIVPTSLSLILPEFPADERAKAVGLWAAMGAVGAAAGPPIGGLLVQGSWRLVFLVSVPVGAAAMVAGARVLREQRDEAATRMPDLPGAVLLAAAVGVLVLGIVEGSSWGWGSGRVLGAFAAAAAGLAVFAWRSARHHTPVVEPAILRLPGFALANAATLLFFAAFGAMVLAAALFLTGVWGYSVLTAGVALMPGPVMAAVGSAVGGRIVTRGGVRAAAVPGGLLYAASMTALALWMTPEPHYVTRYLPWNLLAGLGIGLVISSLSAAVAASLPPGRFATGTAIFSMARQIGIALGVAILVAIVATPDAADPVGVFVTAWTAMAAGGVVVAALATGLGGARRPVAAQPATA